MSTRAPKKRLSNMKTQELKGELIALQGNRNEFI